MSLISVTFFDNAISSAEVNRKRRLEVASTCSLSGICPEGLRSTTKSSRRLSKLVLYFRSHNFEKTEVRMWVGPSNHPFTYRKGKVLWGRP